MTLRSQSFVRRALAGLTIWSCYLCYNYLTSACMVTLPLVLVFVETFAKLETNFALLVQAKYSHRPRLPVVRTLAITVKLRVKDKHGWQTGWLCSRGSLIAGGKGRLEETVLRSR